MKIIVREMKELSHFVESTVQAQGSKGLFQTKRPFDHQDQTADS